MQNAPSRLTRRQAFLLKFSCEQVFLCRDLKILKGFAKNWLPLLFNAFVEAKPGYRSHLAGAIAAYSSIADPSIMETFFKTVVKKLIKVSLFNNHYLLNFPSSQPIVVLKVVGVRYTVVANGWQLIRKPWWALMNYGACFTFKWCDLKESHCPPCHCLNLTVLLATAQSYCQHSAI